MQPQPSMQQTPYSPASATQYATFQIGDLLFGIDVMSVQEVLRFQEMTRVPLAPGFVRGLINLRGQIVTAIDLRERMNLKTLVADTLPMNVVVRCVESVVSLLVDEIGDVVDVHGRDFEDTPVNVPLDQRSLVKGVYKLEGRLLLILDIERVLQHPMGTL